MASSYRKLENWQAIKKYLHKDKLKPFMPQFDLSRCVRKIDRDLDMSLLRREEQFREAS